ncbi:MAG: cell surface protein SprA [Candidatus Eiseniibacteriota bacterium]
MTHPISRDAPGSRVPLAAPRPARPAARRVLVLSLPLIVGLTLLATPEGRGQVGYGIEDEYAKETAARRDSIRAARRAAEEAARRGEEPPGATAESPGATGEPPGSETPLVGPPPAATDTTAGGARPGAGPPLPGATEVAEPSAQEAAVEAEPSPEQRRRDATTEAVFARLVPPAALEPPAEERYVGPPPPPRPQPRIARDASVALWDWAPDADLRTRRASLLGRQVEPLPASEFAFRVNGDRRSTDVEVDLDHGLVTSTTQVGGVTVERSAAQDFEAYARESVVVRSWDDWRREVRTRMIGRSMDESPIGVETTRGVTLSSDFSHPMEGIIGRGAQITIRGTERITISGTSRWDANLTETDTRRQSKFPQLDLRQDLNIGVDGQIGDKVTIDWKENSNADTPLSNRIAIRYQGYEDEVIKNVDLGNTSLALPGTGFVSYNGQHQGLFGIKTASQFGDIDFTMIASKQEGQTASSGFTGRAQETSNEIYDIEYVQRRFFFLVDPADPQLSGVILPPDDPDWVPPPIITDLQVWRDDFNQQNNGSAVEGALFLDPNVSPPDSVEGFFDVLVEQEDYILRNDLFSVQFGTGENAEIYNYPVLDMLRPIGPSERLGATFTATYADGSTITYGLVPSGAELGRFKALYVPAGEFNIFNGDFFSPEDFWYPVRNLELRNIYSLGGRDLDLSTLELTVRIRTGELREYLGDDPEATYLRMLGLDRQDEFGTPGFDDIVDRDFIYPGEGLLVLPDLRPFAPGAIDMGWPFFVNDLRALQDGGAPGPAERPALFYTEEDRPDSLDPGLPLGTPNRAIYDKRNPNRGEDGRYYFEVSYATQQTQFVLSAPGTILEGSESVVVDGQTLQRGRDYHIDYETGIVRLTGAANVATDAEVQIDYAYAPLFALGQKTLMGFNVGYKPSPERQFGATWLFEGAGVSERRPKLGEEPSRTIVGSLNGSVRSEPFWLTRAVDRLPLLRANGDSRLDIGGEVALSLPNPNTRGEVYLDDFEGAKETSVLSMNREQWFWSSRPDTLDDDAAHASVFDRGGLLWYNPVVSPVQERDLFPDLDELEGDDRRQILMLRIEPPDTLSSLTAAETWVGLSQGLSATGADFTRKQFIEVWLNDFQNPEVRNGRAEMVIDLGTVSEDAFWDPGELANGVRDLEDLNRDGILDLNEAIEDGYEDTGFDNLRSPDEPGYDPSTNPDPNGDDFMFDRSAVDDIEDAFEYDGFRDINQFEDNRRLDDEDINRDNSFQGSTSNNYFEYRVNLSDPTFVATDVFEEFPNRSWVAFGSDDNRDPEVGNANGWRLFRIPIDTELRKRVNSPSLGSVRHLRIWFTGFDRPVTVQIAGVDILGNLYQVEALHDSTGAVAEPDPSGIESFKVRGINNKEDANEYIPPFELEEQDRITERESALALDFERLRPGIEGTAFRTFPNDRDFTLYETLKWYLYNGQDPTQGGVAAQGVEAFVRFGADTLNFYELAVPLETPVSSWREILIPITELSDLKAEAAPDDSTYGRTLADGRRLKFVGRPSFTRVRRMTFGIRNISADRRTGTVWYNDLRLDDVIRDIGTATRFNVDAALADFMTIGADITTQDEDFLSIGSSGRQTVNRGSGSKRREFRIRSTAQLHKFAETTGLRLPVSFNFSDTQELPEFRVGDDVVLDADASNNQKRGSTRRSINANLSRQGGPETPALMRYTLDGLRADFSLSDSRGLTQTRRDSSRTIAVGLNYSINPSLRPIRIGGSEIRYFPENLSFSARVNSQRSFNFSRDLDNPAVRQLISQTFNKTAQLNASGSLNPLRSLRSTYRVDSSRDLTYDNPAEWLFGFNIGTETRRTQDLTINWNPPAWRLAPNFTFRGGSRDDHSPNLQLASDSEQVRNISASRSLSAGATLPLTALTGRAGPRGGARAPGDSVAGTLEVVQMAIGRVGRFQDVRVSANLSESRDFSYATGVPRWQYYLGFSTHPGPDVRVTSRGRQSFSKSRGANLSSGIDFAGGVSSTAAYGFSKQEREASFSVPRVTTTRTWPDVDVNWRQAHTKLAPLQRVFRTLNVNSRYTRDRSESGPRGDESQNVTVRSNWNPIIGLNGSLSGGWSSRMQYTSSSTRTRDNNAGLGRIDFNRRRQLTLSFSRRFDRRSGIKLPWMDEPKKLNGDLTLNFDVSRSTDFAENGRAGQPSTITRDSSNTSFRTGTTYKWRQNVDTTFSFNYGRNNNNKTGQKLRTLSLSLSLVFNF